MNHKKILDNQGFTLIELIIATAIAMVVMAAIFLYRGFEFSRPVVLIGWVFSGLAVGAVRVTEAAVQVAARRRGVGTVPIAIVGAGHTGRMVVDRIDSHPAFSTTQGDVDNSGLPGHPHCQGAYCIQRLGWVEADSAFCRPASVVVLHPETLEDFHRAVVHRHRDSEVVLALRPPQKISETAVELKFVGHGIELPLSLFTPR